MGAKRTIALLAVLSGLSLPFAAAAAPAEAPDPAAPVSAPRAAGQAPAAPEPYRVLSGELTRADYNHYVEVPFDLPAGVVRLTVRFGYGGREQHSVIDLGLVDPERFRGWSGGSRTGMTLSTEDASPGYLPGPLPAGRWTLLLGVPNIRPGVRAPYRAEIFIERKPGITEFADAPLDPKPGWYRGDLHMHSGNSDGKCRSQTGKQVSCPAYRTVEAAARRGLDFIALTDHNTTAQFDALRRLQPAFDRLLLVPGREITTFFGHANAFGPTAFVDFRTLRPDYADARGWIDAVNAAGGLVSINHAGSPTGEICMGCGWGIPDLPDGAVGAIEAVNGGTWRETGAADSPLQGIALWQAWLDRGRHVTAIGGSDSHDADRPAVEPGAVGTPTTVIYMPELSVHGLLAGIRSGRAFIDTVGMRGRMLDFSAASGGRLAHMGETLRLRRGQVVRFAPGLAGVDAGILRLVFDGRADPAYAVRFDAGHPPVLPVWRGDGRAHWVRAEVRDADGHLLLFGNPVYFVPVSRGAAAR